MFVHGDGGMLFNSLSAKKNNPYSLTCTSILQFYQSPNVPYLLFEYHQKREMSACVSSNSLPWHFSTSSLNTTPWCASSLTLQFLPIKMDVKGIGQNVVLRSYAATIIQITFRSITKFITFFFFIGMVSLKKHLFTSSLLFSETKQKKSH